VSEYEQGGALARELLALMPQMTNDRIGEIAFANAERNLAHRDIGHSLKALRGAFAEQGDSAIIVGAGPSLHRQDAARKIKESGYAGTIVATDSAIRWCLKNDIVPDLVVTVDPHGKRIVRWFGDPDLVEADVEADDYYSRQDMDPAFRDQVASNMRVLELVDKHAPDIKIAVSTSASPEVVARIVDTGMQAYWWNPMLDDPDVEGSVTRKLQRLNGLPCMNAGGTGGAACWMMASAVLGKKHIALIGIDLGYYDSEPYSSTQYYREAIDLVGEENLDQLFVRIYNPHLEQWYYTDPAYLWYRNALIEMTADADCETYNCTEGGILFADHIHFEPLSDFLRAHSRG